jgi:serine/threonine protein kinase
MGTGSYSVVYRGRSLLDNRPVAIKVVNKSLIKDELAYENMKKEIKIMGELDHPNIIKFHAVFQTVNNIYIIMEYCNEGTLLQLIRKGPLAEDRVWAFIEQLGRALRYLTNRNILHRDLKPENILLSNSCPKLIDFGFACTLEHGLQTVLVDNMGSPLYMSPQLLVGEVYTPKSDIWSLGIIIYEMVYGHTPWPSADKESLVYNTLNVPLQIQRGPSQDIIELIIGCLRIREWDRLGYPELFKILDTKKKALRPATIILREESKPAQRVSVKSDINYSKKDILETKLSGLSTIHYYKPKDERAQHSFFKRQGQDRPPLPVIGEESPPQDRDRQDRQDRDRQDRQDRQEQPPIRPYLSPPPRWQPPPPYYLPARPETQDYYPKRPETQEPTYYPKTQEPFYVNSKQ